MGVRKTAPSQTHAAGVKENAARAADASTALGLRVRAAAVLRRLGVDPALARFALLVFALSRAALVLLTAFAARFLAPMGGPGAGGGWFLSAWVRFDATFYARLAADGYSRLVPYREGFFPLLPWVVHVLALPFGGPRYEADYIIAIVAANAAYLVALLGLAALTAQLWPGDSSVAKRAMLYLTLFPAALFLFAGYAESLFLALAIWSVVAMRHRRWWLAGALGLLAALTRQVGVLLALPFAYEYCRAIGWSWRRIRLDAAAVALFPAGPLIFSLWLWRTTGDPLGWVHAQTLVATHHLAPPWVTLWGARTFVHDLQSWLFWRNGSDLLCVALVAALIAAGARRLPLGDTAYTAAVWLLTVSYATPVWPLQSDARYMLAAFPALLTLARLGHRRWLNAAVLAVFTLFSVMMTLLFVRGARVL